MEADNNRWNRAKLRVVGRLKFQRMQENGSPAATYLDALIREVDKVAPWVPKDGDEYAPWFEIEEDTDSVVTFTISPQFVIYSRQLHAFHRYLCRIAENIASSNIDELAWVNISMTVSNDDDFRFITRTGREFMDQACKVVREFLETDSSAT